MTMRSLAMLAVAVCLSVRPFQTSAADVAADHQLVQRLDCLINMPGPREGIASKAFLPFLSETREWLSGDEAQDAVLRGLPKLTTRQLVTLWDVLWINPNTNSTTGTPRDMNALAAGFARRFNDAALSALDDEKKDASRRRLLINMVKPQAHTLSEDQASRFLKAGGWKE